VVRVAACPLRGEDKSSSFRPDRDQQFIPSITERDHVSGI
jgi:hypothetical protein